MGTKGSPEFRPFRPRLPFNTGCTADVLSVLSDRKDAADGPQLISVSVVCTTSVSVSPSKLQYFGQDFSAFLSRACVVRHFSLRCWLRSQGRSQRRCKITFYSFYAQTFSSGSGWSLHSELQKCCNFWRKVRCGGWTTLDAWERHGNVQIPNLFANEQPGWREFSSHDRSCCDGRCELPWSQLFWTNLHRKVVEDGGRYALHHLKMAEK